MKHNILFLYLFMLISACSTPESKPVRPAATQLPDAALVPSNITMKKGAELFMANCQTCHTARYIQMQPKLSRKTWEKTVEKMRHSYGAPIDSAAAIQIVDYLMRQQE